MKKFSDTRGFTLIELAAVLTIAAIMLAAFSGLVYSYMDYARARDTETREAQIRIAIERYINLNGRLPCPASLTADIETPEYGVESSDDCASNAAGTFNVSGRGGRDVRIGAIPVRSLHLPDTHMVDGWQRRFLYASTIELSEKENYKEVEGAISILDSAGNPVQTPQGTALYAVVSHGANGAGAFSVYGRPYKSCTAALLESENCDRSDAVFITTGKKNKGSNNYYDDIVIYGSQTRPDAPIDGTSLPAGAVVAFKLASCPAVGWAPMPSMAGRTIIGAGAYTPPPFTAAHYSNGGNADSAINYSRGQIGGAPMTTLVVANIPTHMHAVNFAPANLGYAPAGGGTAIATYGTGTFGSPVQTAFWGGTSGAAVPFNAYQPYMALIYCKKT